MARVLLAMSGGVDSSVAAHLLRALGHEVIGLFMRHGHAAAGRSSVTEDACLRGELPVVTSPKASKQGCCSAADACDARRVADQLGIPFYALDFADDFGQIIDYFVAEYTAGRTPNPCVMCNNWLKFGRLLQYADGVGADFVATGHYARLGHSATGRPQLHRGLDPAKDQSYVLFGLPRASLARVLFPIGEFRKPAIRQLARQLELRVAEKPDSQEICFVPDGDYAAFVERQAPDHIRGGEIALTDGTVVGHHSGIEQFTVGQRKGLGVALGDRRYVLRIEPQERRVVIGPREELARREFTASRANWLVDAQDVPGACDVKIRYNARPTPAQVTPLEAGRFRVTLADPQFGVAPGQAVVCYQGDQVLGGGWID